MLSAKQLKLYHDTAHRAYLAEASRQLSVVSRQTQDSGLRTPDSGFLPEGAWRRAEVVAVLGQPLTKAASNAELDRVLDHFEAIEHADEFDPATLGGPDRATKRLVWVCRQRIREYGETFLSDDGRRSAPRKVLRERFGIVFDEELNQCDAETLRRIAATFTARIAARRQKLGGTDEHAD